MPFGPGTYGNFGYNAGSLGGNTFGLFDDFTENPFDLGLDIDEELSKSEKALQETDKELNKTNRKADRKQRLIEALPFIAAALTGDDKDATRALMAFSQLKAEEKDRRERLKAQREERRAKFRQRELEREDIQTFESQQRQLARGFRSSERRAEQEFRREERIASQVFDLRRDDKNFRQDLIKMGYNHEMATELEEIQHKHRIAQQAQGFENNSELFRRQVAEEQAVRMERVGIAPDIARQLSDKITHGVPADELNPQEQAAMDLYTKWNKSNTEQERSRALLETTLGVMNTQVNVTDENGDPVIDPFSGRTVKRFLDPSEVVPFITQDPESAIRELITPKDPRGFDTSEGTTTGQLSDDVTYDRAAEFVGSDDRMAQVLREEVKRIDSDTRAAELAAELYQQFGLTAAKGMIDNLQIDPKYKPLMEQVIEEADIKAKERKESLDRILGQGSSSFSGIL